MIRCSPRPPAGPNRANLLHWAAANIRDPGAPVPANLGPEPLGIARDLVRRGLDDAALQTYRIGQNVAWRFWMEIAFGLTSDPQELHELLDVSSHSITSFIDATIAGSSAQIQLEREELTRGTHAETTPPARRSACARTEIRC
jgi:DNA-binding PucR family transcriptional regulator